MPKHKNSYDLPSERGTQRMFYGYENSMVTGDEGVSSPFPDVITVYSGSINNYNSPISIFKKFNEDLAIYSVGGLEVLDIYTGKEEKAEYAQAFRSNKAELYK